MVMFTQLCGSFAGILAQFVIVKLYVVPAVKPTSPIFVDRAGDPLFMKVIFFEVLLTFTFTLAFLMFKNKPTLVASDEVVKGLGLSVILNVCYTLSANSQAYLNPAIAITETCLYAAQQHNLRDMYADYDHKPAIYLWVYMFAPMAGAALAASMMRFHSTLENYGQE